MLKVERQKIIREELQKQGFVLVPALGKLFNCSEETIRRDLKEMENNGTLVRTHGGAYQVENYDKGYPLELRKSYMPKTKANLSKLVLGEIKENDVLMIDSSSTCLSLMQEIVARQMNVTVVTNSLAIFNLCNKEKTGVNLICVGGAFRRRTSSFADPNTVEALRNYHADKAFISCPKVTIDFGLSDNHISEANVRKQMLRQSEKKYLLADHTKFDASATIPFEGLEQLDFIVTDHKLPGEWLEYAKQHRITIRYAEE